MLRLFYQINCVKVFKWLIPSFGHSWLTLVSLKFILKYMLMLFYQINNVVAIPVAIINLLSVFGSFLLFCKSHPFRLKKDSCVKDYRRKRLVVSVA